MIPKSSLTVLGIERAFIIFSKGPLNLMPGLPGFANVSIFWFLIDLCYDEIAIDLLILLVGMESLGFIGDLQNGLQGVEPVKVVLETENLFARHICNFRLYFKELV